VAEKIRIDSIPHSVFPIARVIINGLGIFAALAVHWLLFFLHRVKAPQDLVNLAKFSYENHPKKEVEN
jgi:hypothetical protein